MARGRPLGRRETPRDEPRRWMGENNRGRVDQGLSRKK